jgi:hypothetical protein
MAGSENVDLGAIGMLKDVALIVFFAIFMIVVLRLIWTSSEVYRRDARIPLDDQPVEERTRKDER